jgi:hypothetical protein
MLVIHYTPHVTYPNESFGSSPLDAYVRVPNLVTAYRLPMFTRLETGGPQFVFLGYTGDNDREMYLAMVNYLATFQEYLHSDLRHTLFLRSPQHIEVPYPDGWYESQAMSGEITITPAAADDAPRIYIATYDQLQQRLGLDDEQVIRYALTSLYNLPCAWEAVNCDEIVETVSSDSVAVYQFEYTFEGRQGYLLLTNHYLIEVSAPVGDVPAVLLDTIVQSIYIPGSNR